MYTHTVCLHHVLFVVLSSINADVKSTFIAVMRIIFENKMKYKKAKLSDALQ